jgi:hypothetical protein
VRRGSTYTSRGKVKALGLSLSVKSTSNEQISMSGAPQLGFLTWIDELVSCGPHIG